MTKDTPPTFLFATTDDKTVPVMNSVMFYIGAGEGGGSGGDAPVSAWGAWGGAGCGESATERVAGFAGEVDAGARLHGGFGGCAVRRVR